MIKLIDIAKLIVEGGNVFDATSPIDKANIEPTLEKFVDEMSRIFPKKKDTFKAFERLGSVGKKNVSGDIDLSYDEYNLYNKNLPDFKGWGVDEGKYNELFQLFTKRARTATPEQTSLRSMVELISNKLDENSSEIEVDTKSSGKGTIFCSIPQYNPQGQKLNKSVQVDINIGSPDWLRFSYHSAIYQSNVKGLHRTQLILTLFSLKGRIFSHAIGVVNKETRENEAKNPEEAAALLNRLFGFEITPEILDDYYKLNTFLKTNLKEEEYNNLISKYLRILDLTRADIPEDLQQFWIDNQDRLQLTGKYLPDNSRLLQYKK
jgi:hypothetical protein